MSRQSPSAQEIKPFLVGVVNIQFTPFPSDTEIDEAALRDNTRHMISRGLVTFKMAPIAGRPMGDHERLPLVRPSRDEHLILRSLMERARMSVAEA